MNRRERTVQVEWMEAPGVSITDDDVAASVRQMVRLEYGDVIANLGVDVRSAEAPAVDVAERQRQRQRHPDDMTDEQLWHLAAGLRQLSLNVTARKPAAAVVHTEFDVEGTVTKTTVEILWERDHED